jgi:hypothetical protein
MIKIYAPDGADGGHVHALAPAPTVLAGKRIAVLDNGKPGADILLGQLAQDLSRRTGASYVGLHRKGSAATPCEATLIDRLAAEADLVLTGTAD